MTDKKTTQKEEPVENAQEKTSTEEQQENASQASGTESKKQEQKTKSTSDSLNEAVEKGSVFIKDMYEKVRHFSGEATELTRLKIDIRNLKSEREHLYTDMGKRLWDLKQTGNFRGINSVFEKDFTRLEEIEKEIDNKEKEAKKKDLSL